MRDVSGVGGRSTLSTDWGPLVPASGLLVVGILSAGLGAQTLASVLIAVVALVLVASRPHWGVAIILAMLMVQYGSRRYERTGWAYVTSLLPAGEGLVTINNVLGLFLALLLVYHVYRDSDWSFLRSRQVQLVAAVTVLLILSAVVNQVDYREQAALGLRVTGQNPIRVMVSRALFLLLFVSFVRRPSELRLIVGVFVALALITAWSGSGAALSGTADAPQAAEYRAGGLSVLIETAGNPNRMAMIATLALVFIWEYGQMHRPQRWGWLATVVVLFLVVSVFLTASRGGVIGLSSAVLMLFVRRRGSAGRFLYGVAVALLAVGLIAQLVPTANIERLSNIPGISADLQGEGAGSLHRRSYTYGIGFQIWSQAPFLGVGLGNWSYMRFTTDPLHSAAAPHNSYLKALTEGGSFCLVLYVWVFGATIRRLGQIERQPEVMARAQADGLAWLVSATRVCLVAFLIFSLFADLWELVFFYLLIGIGATLIRMYDGGSLRSRPA